MNAVPIAVGRQVRFRPEPLNRNRRAKKGRIAYICDGYYRVRVGSGGGKCYSVWPSQILEVE